MGGLPKCRARSLRTVFTLVPFGKDHPDTILTCHELAWVTASRGRLREAESRYCDVLSHSRRTLGEDHPRTLATQEALEELRRGRIIDARHLA
jgi:hypothetical protein